MAETRKHPTTGGGGRTLGAQDVVPVSLLQTKVWKKKHDLESYFKERPGRGGGQPGDPEHECQKKPADRAGENGAVGKSFNQRRRGEKSPFE